MSKYYDARNAAETAYAEYCASTKAPRAKRPEPHDAYAEYAKTVALVDPVDYTHTEHCTVHPDYAFVHANDE